MDAPRDHGGVETRARALVLFEGLGRTLAPVPFALPGTSRLDRFRRSWGSFGGAMRRVGAGKIPAVGGTTTRIYANIELRDTISLRFYAVGSSLFLLSVCFCLCSLFYRDGVLCWLLLARPFLYAFHAHLRFPVDLVWFRLSCDHGWIRSGSVNVRKQHDGNLQYVP